MACKGLHVIWVILILLVPLDVFLFVPRPSRLMVGAGWSLDCLFLLFFGGFDGWMHLLTLCVSACLFVV